MGLPYGGVGPVVRWRSHVKASLGRRGGTAPRECEVKVPPQGCGARDGVKRHRPARGRAGLGKRARPDIIPDVAYGSAEYRAFIASVPSTGDADAGEGGTA